MISNETNSVDSVGTSTPKNIYSALISHAWDLYRANISVKKADPYTSATNTSGTSYGTFGDYTRVDANIARDFKFQNYTATAKLYGRNLTDDHYATKGLVSGGKYYFYNDRGRTLGIELSLAF